MVAVTELVARLGVAQALVVRWGRSRSGLGDNRRVGLAAAQFGQSGSAMCRGGGSGIGAGGGVGVEDRGRVGPADQPAAVGGGRAGDGYGDRTDAGEAAGCTSPTCACSSSGAPTNTLRPLAAQRGHLKRWLCLRRGATLGLAANGPAWASARTVRWPRKGDGWKRRWRS
jgi:hypothetical protein